MSKHVNIPIYFNQQNKFEDIICQRHPNLVKNIILKEEIGFFEMNLSEQMTLDIIENRELVFVQNNTFKEY